MSRPPKCRRVCSLPKACHFSPVEMEASSSFSSEVSEKNAGEFAGNSREIVITIDEYETLRLLDYEGLTQAECARQMNVARATVTLMYERVRRKIADAFVNSRSITIEGGNVVVCNHAGSCCGICGKEQAKCGKCTTKQCIKKERNI